MMSCGGRGASDKLDTQKRLDGPGSMGGPSPAQVNLETYPSIAAQSLLGSKLTILDILPETCPVSFPDPP